MTGFWRLPKSWKFVQGARCVGGLGGVLLILGTLPGLSAQPVIQEAWRNRQPAGFGSQQSNRYSSGLSPIPQKDSQNPARLLNYLTPSKGLSAQQTSRSSGPPQEPEGTGGQERIDGLLENELKAFDSQTEAPTNQGTEIVRQRYPDGKIQVEREVMQDDLGNYQNHGWWKLYNKSGQVVGDGIFQRGLMEGPWKRLHAANEPGIFSAKPFDLFQGPFLSTATFEKGKLNGVWQIHDRNQRKIMEISYLAGKRHGPATWWYPNGSKMREMLFRDGVIDGTLREWDQNKKVAREEEFIQGRKVTLETSEYAPERKKTQIQRLEPVLVLREPDDWWEAKPAAYETEGEATQHGPFMAWYENGQLEMQGQFFDDLREGQFTWWHANGQKSVLGSYRKGLKDGLWIWWHPSGMKLAEGHYEQDRAVGKWTQWDEQGKIVDRKDLSPDAPLPDPKKQSETVESKSSEHGAPRPDPENLNGEPKVESIDPELNLEGQKPEEKKEGGTFPNREGLDLADPPLTADQENRRNEDHSHFLPVLLKGNQKSPSELPVPEAATRDSNRYRPMIPPGLSGSRNK